MKVQQIKTLAALLIATLGTMAVVWVRPEWVVPHIAWLRSGESAYEFNRRGQPAVVEVWRKGHLVLVKQDTRREGRFDAFTYYENDQPVMFEYDRNYNGVIDYRTIVGPDGRERIEVLRDGAFVEVRPKPREAAP